MVRSAARMAHLPHQFFAALTAKAAAMTAQGMNLINLGQGNPDLPTPPHIVETLREAALDPAMHRYPPFRGLPGLRHAICAWYQAEFDVQLDPQEEVAILFGGKAGLVEISQCLLDPGDVALVPDPGYPDYWSGIALAGAQMVSMPLLEENGFLPDFAKVKPEDAARARLLFLNYPSNPTAAVADALFFERAVAFARQHDIVIAHDFAYGAIGFDGKPVSFLQTPGAKEVGVEFYTLSKTYNMAGWRVGFALGNRDVVQLLNQWQDHSYVSLFGAVQQAAIAALSGSQTSVEALVDTYRGRRDAFLQTLSAGGMRTLPAHGSFFVWLPVPTNETSSAFADRLLREEHVVVAPGIGFGQAGEGYVRVAMLDTEQRLREAAMRILRCAGL